MALAKIVLTGSTDGKPIPVAATATPGTTLHTVAGAAPEEIWLWLSNIDSAERNVTIEWGGATDPDNHLVKTLALPPNSGPICVCPGLVLKNSLAIKAFCSSASKVNATGYAITGI